MKYAERRLNGYAERHLGKDKHRQKPGLVRRVGQEETNDDIQGKTNAIRVKISANQAEIEERMADMPQKT